MNIIYRGSGCEITEENGIYQISWEQGAFGQAAQYEISGENAEKAMRSDQDAYEVKISAETGKWPLTEEQLIEKAKDFIRNRPR